VLALGRHHEHARFGVVLEARVRLGELAQHAKIERVALVRPIEPRVRDSVFHRVLDPRCVAHARASTASTFGAAWRYTRSNKRAGRSQP
jgi:hypothetical protein